VTASLLAAALRFAASVDGLRSSRGRSLDRSGRLLGGRGSLNGSSSGGTSDGSLSLGGSSGSDRAGAGARVRTGIVVSGGSTLGLLSNLALGDLNSTLDQSRAGDGIASRVAVDVELDALVVRLIQLSSKDTLGLLSTGTLDLEVEALRVVLGTVLLETTMESNDLVTEDIGTGLNVLRDLNEPAVVVGNELVGAVGTGVTGIDETNLVDLEELEGLLIDGLTASRTARGQHVNDRSLVALGPVGPLDVDLVTGLDLGVTLGVLSTAVADDVCRAEGIRGYITVVGSGG